jgi:hypothetical protein
MENKSKITIPREETPTQLRQRTIIESFKKLGIPARDTTMEHISETSLTPSHLQQNEKDDSAATMIRNLNRRKGKPDKE